MGFTIDMVSGNVSNITNGVVSELAEVASPKNSSSEGVGGADIIESLQEQLLPVVDTLSQPDCLMPSSLINCDIGSFVEEVSR